MSNPTRPAAPGNPSAFAIAVESGLTGLKAVSTGTCPGCEICRADLGFDTVAKLEAAYEAGKVVDEPFFSQSPCECCGSRLGGDREAAHGIESDGSIAHFHVCVDCALYLANGDEPENWEG